MKSLIFLLVVVVGVAACASGDPTDRGAPSAEARLPRRDASSTRGVTASVAPSVSSVVTDPWWQLEREGVAAYGGPLADLTRSATPIAIGGVVYAHARAGSYVDCATTSADCGPAHWETVAHQVRAFAGGAGGAVLWTHTSTWRPVPGVYGLVSFFEPLFQFAASGANLYVPQANGRVAIVSRATGATIATSPSPLDGGAGDLGTYVTSPIVADAAGNAWYTVTALTGTQTLRAAWLVRMAPSGAIATRTFADLAPAPASNCIWSYAFTRFLPQPFTTPLPWPPASGVSGPIFGCGGFRPQINAAPALASDGSVVVVARGSLSDYARLIRVRGTDLRTLQDISLRGMLNDDCGVATPSDALDGQQTTTSCRAGTTVGVDRTTGVRPGARAVDTSTSSPLALPDGGVAIGTYSQYRNQQGHLLVINADGSFRWARSFGWLSNAAVRIRPASDGGLPGYDLVAKYSAYDFGPFWVQLLDAQTGARKWSHSEGAQTLSAEQCLSTPGGATACLQVTGGGAAEFISRRALVTVAGDVIDATSAGDVITINGATGASVSSVHVFDHGGGTDVPLTADGSKLHLVSDGKLFTVEN